MVTQYHLLLFLEVQIAIGSTFNTAYYIVLLIIAYYITYHLALLLEVVTPIVPTYHPALLLEVVMPIIPTYHLALLLEVVIPIVTTYKLALIIEVARVLLCHC